MDNHEPEIFVPVISRTTAVLCVVGLLGVLAYIAWTVIGIIG